VPQYDIVDIVAVLQAKEGMGGHMDGESKAEESLGEAQPQKPVVRKTKAKKPVSNLGEQSQDSTTDKVRGAC
jgi:hypothetical protein